MGVTPPPIATVSTQTTCHLDHCCLIGFQPWQFCQLGWWVWSLGIGWGRVVCVALDLLHTFLLISASGLQIKMASTFSCLFVFYRFVGCTGEGSRKKNGNKYRMPKSRIFFPENFWTFINSFWTTFLLLLHNWAYPLPRSTTEDDIKMNNLKDFLNAVYFTQGGTQVY